MKIVISRSFSKKVQLKQFEPIESFCAAEVELPVAEEKSMSTWAERLDEFCRIEVEKTLTAIRPSLKNEQGKSAQERKEDAKNSAQLDAANE